MKSIGQMADAARRLFTKFTERRNPWKDKALELARENERLKIEAQQSRAMLLQLRVDPGVYHDRLGYMIGTFVPEGVVKKLQANPDKAQEFKRTVVDVMMESVLRGFLFRKPENDKCVALVFVPRGEKMDRSTVLPMFECNGKFNITASDKFQKEINQEIELQRANERKMLGY